MRVHVDEAGCDGEAVGVDLLASALVDDADLGDQPAVDGHVRGDRSPAEPVEHPAIADDEVVHGLDATPRRFTAPPISLSETHGAMNRQGPGYASGTKSRRSVLQ